MILFEEGGRKTKRNIIITFEGKDWLAQIDNHVGNGPDALNVVSCEKESTETPRSE